MARVAEQLVGRRGLHDLAEIHYGDAVGDVLHDREIVADEDVGETEALLQRAHQVDDLRLDRDVERRHGFICHDQPRLDGEGARDRQALALAAGEFVRIAPGVLGAQADQLEQLADPRAPLRLVADEVMEIERLAQHRADRHARIEAGIGVLEDHLQAATARAHLVGVERQQVVALEAHLAGAGLDQPQHEAADGRLAAARLAHHRERLAFLDMEVDAIDRADMRRGAAEDTALHREVLGQPFDLEQRAHGWDRATPWRS